MARQAKSAVVIGASGTIGAALEATLIEEGEFDVVHGFARSREGARELDILDEESLRAAAALVAKGPPPELVIVATGLLDEAGDEESGATDAMAAICAPDMANLYAANAIGPALVAKHFVPLLPRDTRAVFAVLSEILGTGGDTRPGNHYGYRAAKAALNTLVRDLAAGEQRRKGRAIIVALHPGSVESPLGRLLAPTGQRIDPERAAMQLLDVIEELKVPGSGKLFDSEGEEVPY